MTDKINERHLSRTAFVCIWQSTFQQVRNNTESGRGQYALGGRSKDLSFKTVFIIDDDFGISGIRSREWPGFAKLLAAVCNGEMEAVFAPEASRLARNNRDWHHLFQACPTDQEIIGVRSDMLVVRQPDGTRRGIPAWMFDEEVCAAVCDLPRPIVHFASLLETVDLLELNGLTVCSAHDECAFKSQGGCDFKVATDTNNTAIGKPGGQQTDPERERGRVHRVDSRVDRNSCQSSHPKNRRVP